MGGRADARLGEDDPGGCEGAGIQRADVSPVSQPVCGISWIAGDALLKAMVADQALENRIQGDLGSELVGPARRPRRSRPSVTA